MANEKIVALEQLEIVKSYIDNKDAAAIKSAEYENNTIKLYTTGDKSGEPAVKLDLPEEMFLDQIWTEFIPYFVWGNNSMGVPNYSIHGAENPNLDGKPVLVIAVKGDNDKRKFSFVSLETLVSKVSEEEGNALVMKGDGFYVPEAPEQTTIEYATDEEVQALFSD